MDKSPLNKLPAELRLDIYEKVLAFEGPLRVTLNSIYPWERTLNPTSSPQKGLLAIKRTCRKIAREAYPVVFRVNTSWTFARPEDIYHPMAWLEWGSRVKEWTRQFDKIALDRVHSLQIDVGTLDVRPRVRMPAHTSVDHAMQMFRNLPPAFQSPAVAHSIILQINWSQGFELPAGTIQRCEPIHLAIPIWGSRRSIMTPIRGTIGVEADRMIALCSDHADDLAARVPNGMAEGPDQAGMLSLAELDGLKMEIVALVGAGRGLESYCEMMCNDQMLRSWVEGGRGIGGRLDHLEQPIFPAGSYG